MLQKRENVRATSNKMMCKTADSQDLKFKREDKWLRHWNYYSSSLLQISVSGTPVVEASFTLSFLYQSQ